jgi:acylphosphatase
VSALHVLVRGRVQGVGFRWFVRETARRADVAGWVRNRPDGSVEVAGEGTDSAIESMRRALALGPPGALVSSVEDLPASAEVAMNRPFAIER